MANFSWQIEHWPTVAAFAAHLAQYDPAICAWAEGITYHHTWKPTVAQWAGRRSMEALGRAYRAKGWSGGPHLFIGPDGIWQGMPLNEPGIHAGPCNAHRWGIEVVGDYDATPWQEPIRSLALGVGAALLNWRRLPVASVCGHRDCMPHQKTCPGAAINLDTVRAALAQLLTSAARPAPADRYRVAAWVTAGAVVRQQPSRSSASAGNLAAGTPILVDASIPDGELYNGSREWVHLSALNSFRDLGFIHRSLVDRDLLFRFAPRISAAQFRRVLDRAGSPAAAQADALYAIPVAAGLDPAIALAFFGHESGFGLQGICRDYGTRNWGNMRGLTDPSRGLVIPTTRGNFAKYSSWQAGLLDWCEHMQQRYISQGLDSVSLALPIYAPSSDSNRPVEYAAAVVRDVLQWQREDGRA
jgi:N-acetylmuramoyl-L-alanine amidase